MYRYSRTALCAPLAYACASTLVSTSGREPPYLSSKLLSAPGRVRSTASAGTPVPAIARLVAADEDTVRDVIHALNDRGLAALDPHWAGGAPRRISDDDVAFIVATATTCPKKLGLPFTHFSIGETGRLPTGLLRQPRPEAGTGTAGAHPPGTAAPDPGRPRHHLP